MNATRPLLACLAAAIAFTSGCKKKPDEQAIASEREQALPAEERVAPAPEKPAPALLSADRAPVLSESEFAAEKQAFEVWCKKYGLDPNDPKMLDADPDGDGATNREEFIAGTNPLDPKSRPGIHADMRLKQYTEVRLPVVLDSVDGEKAHLKPAEGDAKPQTVKAGDTLPGLPYKIERVEEKHDTDKGGNPIDVSNLTLHNPTTQERVVLMKGMPAKTSATSAQLVSDDGKTTITVHVGETFEWPGTPGAHYQVTDMSEDHVVVKQVENRKMWTILRE